MEHKPRGKILLVHAFYQQRGGEDVAVETELALMLNAGWDVQLFAAHNNELKSKSAFAVAANTIWSSDSARKLAEAIDREQPSVVHFHNTFPILSPAVFRVAKRKGVRVIATLHNYRLGCLNGTLFRDGSVCHKCLGKVPISGIIRGCYRGRAESAVLAATIQTHRALSTYQSNVDKFITLSEWSRHIYEQIGIPSGKMTTKVNTVFPEPTISVGATRKVAFVGRLSEEKGIRILLDAWTLCAGLPELEIIGDGPLAGLVDQSAKDDPRITWHGALDKPASQRMIGDCALVVIPSVCYEGCSMVMIEALAQGTPVVAASFDSFREHLGEVLSDLLFEPGNPFDLSQVLVRALSRAPDLRQAARSRYEERFSNAVTLATLESIYSGAASGSADAPA